VQICERCRSEDGRRVDSYRVKGGRRVFCDDCALVTAEHHDIGGNPPKAQEAEAAAEEATEAQEAEAPAEESKPSKKKKKGGA
jgi:hypothetical protein